ncbi:MAG TPA: hypothetical protein VD772_07945, partial [Anseongella sp.]|nr:hypothetical protein [Anseongella sp.]
TGWGARSVHTGGAGEAVADGCAGGRVVLRGTAVCGAGAKWFPPNGRIPAERLPAREAPGRTP